MCIAAAAVLLITNTLLDIFYTLWYLHLLPPLDAQ